MRFTFASASYVEIWNFAQSMPQNAAYSHPGAVLFMPKSIYYPPLFLTSFVRFHIVLVQFGANYTEALPCL